MWTSFNTINKDNSCAFKWQRTLCLSSLTGCCFSSLGVFESEEQQECADTTFRWLVLPLCTPLCRQCNGSCYTPPPSGCCGETEARNSGKSFQYLQLNTDKGHALSLRRAATLHLRKGFVNDYMLVKSMLLAYR